MEDHPLLSMIPVISEAFDRSLLTQMLEPQQQQLLAFFNGRRTLGAVAAMLQAPHSLIIQDTNRLLQLEIISVHPPHALSVSSPSSTQLSPKSHPMRPQSPSRSLSLPSIPQIHSPSPWELPANSESMASSSFTRVGALHTASHEHIPHTQSTLQGHENIASCGEFPAISKDALGGLMMSPEDLDTETTHPPHSHPNQVRNFVQQRAPSDLSRFELEDEDTFTRLSHERHRPIQNLPQASASTHDSIVENIKTPYPSLVEELLAYYKEK